MFLGGERTKSSASVGREDIVAVHAVFLPRGSWGRYVGKMATNSQGSRVGTLEIHATREQNTDIQLARVERSRFLLETEVMVTSHMRN